MRKKPKRPYRTKAEIEKEKTLNHTEAETDRLLREAERSRRKAVTEAVNKRGVELKEEDQDRVTAAMELVDHLSTAPGNEDLLAEHISLRQLRRDVDDLAAVTKRVAPAVDQDGNRGAFLVPNTPQSAGLWRQFLGMVGGLLGRPVDMTMMDQVRTGKKLK